MDKTASKFHCDVEIDGYLANLANELGNLYKTDLPFFQFPCLRLCGGNDDDCYV